MAITNIDNLLGGMQPPINVFKVGAATTIGRFYNPMYALGYPGQSQAPPPDIGLAGTGLTSYIGCLTFSGSSSANTYLARFAGSVNVNGTLFLCDRLWHNSGMTPTLTSLQVVNSRAWPPRDRDGLSAGTDVMIGAEVAQVMGGGTPTFAMHYINSQGVGHSAITAAQTATMALGSFIPIQLVSGDTGVRQVTGWTQSTTMTGGKLLLVAYRILAQIDITGIGNAVDAISSGFPKLYSGTTPFLLWLPATTTAPTIHSQVIYTQG